MECPLDFEEDVLFGHPANRHTRRPERRLHPSQQTVKFCEKLLVFLPRSFDAFRSGEAQASARFHCSFPFEVRRLMMDSRVPDEIQMKEVLQIESGGFPAPPQIDVETVEFPKHLAFVPALPNVTRYQIARALRNLKSHLD